MSDLEVFNIMHDMQAAKEILRTAQSLLTEFEEKRDFILLPRLIDSKLHKKIQQVGQMISEFVQDPNRFTGLYNSVNRLDFGVEINFDAELFYQNSFSSDGIQSFQDRATQASSDYRSENSGDQSGEIQRPDLPQEVNEVPIAEHQPQPQFPPNYDDLSFISSNELQDP